MAIEGDVRFQKLFFPESDYLKENVESEDDPGRHIDSPNVKPYWTEVTCHEVVGEHNDIGSHNAGDSTTGPDQGHF